MKRFTYSIFLVLVLLVVGVLLSGCQSKKVDPNTITFWHWMTDRHDVFQELAKQYSAETGITVNVELYAPSDAYTQKVIASAQSRILPDIYGILDKKKIFASFIESGYVADLTADIEANNGEWKDSFFPKALKVNQFTEGNEWGIAPGYYGVPIDVTNIQMLYNKNLLKKAGIDQAPRNFQEFLQAVNALNKIGISGLVSGWGELWMADCFASNYAFNIMGEEKVLNTYRGKVPYTDPDWVKVFQVFETLAKNKAFIEGIVTKPNKNAEQDFALERAAFAFNGSWSVNVYHKMNNELEYGVMLPPPVNTERPMSIWGGAGSSFVVNASSPNKDKAIAFLKWFTAKEQQAVLSQETRNLPANKEALKNIDDVLADYAKQMEFTTHPTIWDINEHPLVVEKFDKGLQSIIIGEKTPQQVAQEVQEVKERVMKK